jgi:hypothetical protein
LNGTWKCEHGRRKRDCKACGGSQVCEHGRRKSATAKTVEGFRFVNMVEEKANAKHVEGVRFAMDYDGLNGVLYK